MKSLLLASVLLYPSAPGFAQTAPPPAPPALTTQLHLLNGQPVKDVGTQESGDPDCAKCAPLTAGHAIANALLATVPGETTVDASQKWARYDLAMRIIKGPVTLTAAEVTVIKKCLGNAYGPLIIGQIIPIIDPNAKAPEVN
jgi:hypothetical protein